MNYMDRLSVLTLLDYYYKVAAFINLLYFGQGVVDSDNGKSD